MRIRILTWLRKSVALLAMAALATSALLPLPPSPAYAQPAGMVLIRDAEIEDTLRTFGTPIWRAAGIPPDSIHIILIQDNTINSFVAEGMNIFFYTGLLLAVDDPGQLVGVIAHETGHIADGHLIRGRDAMESAQIESILGLLVGVAAGVAAGDAGTGVAVAAGNAGVAQRSWLAYSRVQEASADNAALRFMDTAHISSRGLLRFFEKLQDQELLPVDLQVAYVRTHPLTQDRIEAVRHHVETSPWSDARLPADWNEKSARMVAKLMGYTEPDTALVRYPASDASIAGRYGRAIAYYRKDEVEKSIGLLDGLIAAEPNNPFFLELKGQILLEQGQEQSACTYYSRAVALLPESGLLQAAYGHALLETNDPNKVDAAIAALKASLKEESDEPLTWRLLSAAWGRKGDAGLSTYALAEEALAKGNMHLAKGIADKAIHDLPKDFPYRLRAEDIKIIATEAVKEEDDQKDK